MSKSMIAILLLGVMNGKAASSATTKEQIEWEAFPPLPYPVSDMSATTLNNKIYLMGGCVQDERFDTYLGFNVCPEITDKLLAFNPTDKMFEVLPKAPTKRYRHTAVAFGDKIYFAGGRTLEDALINTIDVFDTTAGAWKSPLPWAYPTSDLASFVDGGNIVLVGGYNFNYSESASNTRVQAFKIDGDEITWVQTVCVRSSSDAACRATIYGDLRSPRADFAAVADKDGKVYAVGGKDSKDYCPGLDTVEWFDPATKQWTTLLSRMNFGRGDNALAIHNGRIIVAGGETNCGSTLQVVADVEALDVTRTDSQWTDEDTDIPVATFRFAATQLGDRVYLFGGQFAASPHNVSDRVHVFTEKEFVAGKTTTEKTMNACGRSDTGKAVLLFFTLRIIWNFVIEY